MYKLLGGADIFLKILKSQRILKTWAKKFLLRRRIYLFNTQTQLLI
jgi:hypothetical protein